MDPVASGSGLCCAVCGNGLRASARFCDACGTPAHPARAAEERKQVTVLFADVVGSMKMAAVLAPERLREIMHELFNRSAAVVQRYQGTVDSFTGDGLMATFGAPTALEDHALRACIAAVEIRSLARQLGVVIRERDNVDLRIRIGVHSGEVIAGDFGPAAGGYAATGHAVGMAKRMETAAEPGEILCSGSTALLVGHSARFGPPVDVTVKGVDQPVPVRRLEDIESDRLVMPRDDGPLLGRDVDLADMRAAFERSETSVVSVVGEPGLGKSRLIREFATAATTCGAEIIVVRCEAHTAHVPLRVVSRMLRAMFGVRQQDAASARRHVATELQRVVEAGFGDVDVLFDLLSVGDPTAAAPTTHADARQRRLIEAMATVVESRSARMVFIVEDLHWVDTASDEFLAEFAAALIATKSMFVGSYRPEYRGRLRDMSETTIALTPLTKPTTVALAAELIGEHPTAVGAAELIAGPSAGNPFFVEEIVRDLVGRRVLHGNRGSYRLAGGVDSIAVPPTVQAVLAARIDRLVNSEKSILNAAAVIGTSFGLDDLCVLLPAVAPVHLRSLLSAELIDQIQLLPEPRYAFRHPLVRAVCYDSQLTTTRADSHRQLATAIENRNQAAVDENSALIAHHLEAAGELAAAYTWHMRSGAWLKYRNVVAARDSWERARQIADRLPADHGEVVANRIAPRAQLTATAWFVAADSEQCFSELRELTSQSGDVLSLALGMSGRVTSLIITEGRVRDAMVMAAELEKLIDEIGSPPAVEAELLMAVAFAQYMGCAFERALRTIDRLRSIPEAHVDDVAPAASVAGVIKVMMGRREEGVRDLEFALDCAHDVDPVAYVIALSNKTDLVRLGFDLADERLVIETRSALQRADAFGDGYGIALARLAHGTALLRSGDRDRDVGLELLQSSRSGGIDIGGSVTEAELATAMTWQDRRDDQIDILRDTVLSEIDLGETLFAGYPVSVLVQLLVDRGAPYDLDCARDIVTVLQKLIAAVSLPALELWPLQCRARLAKATGDATTYTQIVARYCELAEELDARGHIAIAKQLAAEPTFAA